MNDIQAASLVGETQVSVGGILSDTFSIFRKMPIFFLLLGVGVTLIVIAAQLWMPVIPGRQWINNVISLIASFGIEALICLAVYRLRTGSPVSIRECFFQASYRILPIIATVIIMILLAGTLFFVSIMLSIMIMRNIIATGILIFVIIIPTLYIYCRIILAVPVCVVEKKGPFASLSRSNKLTYGFRWKVFGSWFVCELIVFVLAAVVSFFMTFSQAFSPMTVYVVQQFVTHTPGILVNILIANVYFNLRSAKEGVGIAALATVFD